MDENPYRSTVHGGGVRKTRASWWLVWAGIVSLLLSAACVIATVAGMIASFNAFATASSTRHPAELAEGISRALIPAYAAVPLVLLGIILIVLGFVIRRPIHY
jgi:hypothetical protein